MTQKKKKINLKIGRKLQLFIIFFTKKGKINKIKIEQDNAITPPNLFGIERGIA
jgi:hypothetical protein